MSQVSIIVPVYNAGNNLYKLNESLVAQTYEDIEIIYVNDGSRDNSLEILQSFAQTDERIKVIDQVNMGGSAARNTGLNAANGEFLYFCDADDYIELDTIEKLYIAAKKNQADIVICNYRDVAPNGEVVRENRKASIFKGQNVTENPEILFLKPAVWNKLFKKALFTDAEILFKDTRIGQDLSTTLRLLIGAKKIIGIPDVLYNYVLHDNTISRSYDKRILDTIKALNIIKDFYESKNVYEIYQEEFEFIAIQNILYQMTKIPLLKSDKKEIYQKLTGYLNQFPNLKQNKYLKRSLIYRVVFMTFTTGWIFNNVLTQQSIKFVNTSPLVYKLLRKLD